MRVVAVAEKNPMSSSPIDARQQGGIGDFEAVEMQDRQHRAVARGVEEFVGVPTCRKRTGFGFAVADDAGDDQIGIVEGRAIGVSSE